MKTTNRSWLDAPECGDGWLPIIYALNDELEERWPGYTIGQIKEKFGLLCYYAYPPEGTEDTDEFYKTIRRVEAQSAYICERCGKPGTTGSVRYWYSTRCDECAPEGWKA